MREAIAQPKMLWVAELAANNDASQSTAAIFRRSFRISSNPSKTVLQLFAYTRYQLFVNGKYVARGPSRYENHQPEYDSHDITALLQRGQNVVAIRVHNDLPTGRIMAHTPGLWFDIRSDDFLADDTCRAIVDRSILPASPHWGSILESVDARNLDGDWTSITFDDTDWPEAVEIEILSDRALWPPLAPRRIPLLRERDVPIDTSSLPRSLVAPADLAIDLPQISQAYVTLDITDADPGSAVEIIHRSPGAEEQTHRYICRAGTQVYRAGDTVASSQIIVRVTSGNLILNHIKVTEVLYPFERVGTFECSDPALNQLWNICVRSLELMSEDAYVDCADRERVEWMDNEPPMYSLTRLTQAGRDASGQLIYSEPRLFAQMLRRTALTAQPDGRVKAHTCSDRFDIHAIMEDRACLWVEGIRNYHNNTGDASLVREVWPAVVRQMDWFLNHVGPRGLVCCREWIVWGNPMGYQVAEGLGINAFVAGALRDAAYLARIVGDESNTKRFAVAYDALVDAINSHLWNDEQRTYYSGLFPDGTGPQLGMFVHKFTLSVDEAGRIEPNFQAALFALDRGIVPPGRIASVRQYLLANYRNNGQVMVTHLFLKQLYAMNDHKHDATIVRLIAELWKPTVESKWQTTFEGLIPGHGSQVHCYGMAPAILLAENVLGVQLTGPAESRTLFLHPRLGELSFVRGVVCTEIGPVEVEWNRERGGGTRYKVTTPAGTSAILRSFGVEDQFLPAGTSRGVLR